MDKKITDTATIDAVYMQLLNSADAAYLWGQLSQDDYNKARDGIKEEWQAALRHLHDVDRVRIRGESR